jgi:hypothetical protein
MGEGHVPAARVLTPKFVGCGEQSVGCWGWQGVPRLVVINHSHIAITMVSLLLKRAQAV